MGRARYVPRRLLVIEPEPFATAEEAWLWYAQCQMARLAGGRLRADMATVPRPCDPDDIHRSRHSATVPATMACSKLARVTPAFSPA